MSLQPVIQAVEAKFGGSVLEKVVDEKKLVKLVVDKSVLVAVASYLRDSHGFDHVKAVSGVDLSRLLKKENKIEVIYHLGSYTNPELHRADLAISVKLDRNALQTPSLTGVWPSCDYHERETYEMFGVVFEG
ncbi:MAG: NADH-quinone oxidoreductase subunit C, partial [Candidatus Caldarchaeum sp.]|nr:NADH-quinone oxidoreductase subunit C [Candidatus Caldarchaeum sp.]